jgi:hypothetical protein
MREGLTEPPHPGGSVSEPVDRGPITAIVLGLIEEDETPLWAVQSVMASATMTERREHARQILRELVLRGDLEFYRRIGDGQPSRKASVEEGLAALDVDDEWEIRDDALLAYATEAGRRRYLAEFDEVVPDPG